MNPTDHRDITYALLAEKLVGLRMFAYQTWQKHGPGTTREVAARGNFDLLSFRPRTTELYQLGLVELIPSETPGEGVYRAVPIETVIQRNAPKPIQQTSFL